MLRPLPIDHYLSFRENLSQPAQPAGVVEVDVGGNDVLGAGKPQFLGRFLDSGHKHRWSRLHYGTVTVLDEVNGEDSVNTGNFTFQAIGCFGDGFKLNGYFFTSRKSGLILLKKPGEGKFLVS